MQIHPRHSLARQRQDGYVVEALGGGERESERERERESEKESEGMKESVGGLEVCVV